ncbi:IRX15/IRX15L/IGXM protein [Dioscorea alata]|uniref:IRX15/IRX15L/IGXM protein n=1 Tax=Dioscorea alata TaxID=55571 RepID=A0ACB7VKA9_DIOAL|nr:IRX15/IRX15L/IGXM protein [Dioscorea alata]
MKSISSAKLILLQPSPNNKQLPIWTTLSLPSHHRVWLIAFISFLTFASLLTLLTTTSSHSPPNPNLSISSAVSTSSSSASPLPSHIFDTLLHYALTANSSSRMDDGDLRAIAAVLRRRAPCNLLIFGLGQETLLWRALNHGGRTVFLDENEYYAAHFEERHPGLEAYDVSYITKVKELPELLAAARSQIKTECRPVQNLLFSDCRLAINDLPNQLYDMAWDVILVDGPRGYHSSSPGRMSAIFTAAVMARSQGAGSAEVLVHDYEREVERVCSEEFLCVENMVGHTDQLAHFVIPRNSAAAAAGEFCVNRTAVPAGSL